MEQLSGRALTRPTEYRLLEVPAALVHLTECL